MVKKAITKIMKETLLPMFYVSKYILSWLFFTYQDIPVYMYASP
jgi:hypothetical protein